MKLGTASLLSVLTLLFAGLSPTAARADPVPVPVDCSAGCHIITCNQTSCVLWVCDASGCTWVTSWSRDKFRAPKSVVDAPNLDARGKATAFPPEVAYVKVCAPGADCDLYQLSSAGQTHLGSFDNIDDAVRAGRAPQRR